MHELSFVISTSIGRNVFACATSLIEMEFEYGARTTLVYFIVGTRFIDPISDWPDFYCSVTVAFEPWPLDHFLSLKINCLRIAGQKILQRFGEYKRELSMIVSNIKSDIKIYVQLLNLKYDRSIDFKKIDLLKNIFHGGVVLVVFVSLWSSLIGVAFVTLLARRIFQLGTYIIEKVQAKLVSKD